MQVLERLVEVQKVDGALFGRTLRQDPDCISAGTQSAICGVGRSETPEEFAYRDIDHTVVGTQGIRAVRDARASPDWSRECAEIPDVQSPPKTRI